MKQTQDEARQLYELYVRQKIEAGIQAAEEGRLVPHEEVKKRFFVPPAIIAIP
jgi:predicted transcriptional regulator